MTKAEEFRLVARILKQFPPCSPARQAASYLIDNARANHSGDALRDQLESFIRHEVSS